MISKFVDIWDRFKRAKELPVPLPWEVQWANKNPHAYAGVYHREGFLHEGDARLFADTLVEASRLLRIEFWDRPTVNARREE